MEISRTVKDVASAGAAVVEAAVDKVAAALEPPVPGAPAPQPPTIEEPTDPRDPVPLKADQGAPDLLTATGDPLEGGHTGRAQQGAYLTTAQGGWLGSSTAD